MKRTLKGYQEEGTGVLDTLLKVLLHIACNAITQPRETHPQALHFWKENKLQPSFPHFEKSQNPVFSLRGTLRLRLPLVPSGIAPSFPFCPALYKVHLTQQIQPMLHRVGQCHRALKLATGGGLGVLEQPGYAGLNKDTRFMLFIDLMIHIYIMTSKRESAVWKGRLDGATLLYKKSKRRVVPGVKSTEGVVCLLSPFVGVMLCTWMTTFPILIMFMLFPVFIQ